MPSTFDKLMAKDDGSFKRLMAMEFLVISATEEIAKLMAVQGVTNSELARRLNRPTRWVTELLRAGHNPGVGEVDPTIRDFAEVVHALGAKITIHTEAE